MKLVQNGTYRVIAEADSYERGQRVRAAMPMQPEPSEVLNEALLDKPVVVEWEVVAVHLTRNVAYAEPVSDGGSET